MTAAPCYTLEQPASRATALLSFAIFLPAACSIFVPIGLVAAHANDVAAAAHEHPLATAQVILGALVWTLLFILPVLRRLQRTGLSRTLVIRDDVVLETTRTLFGTHDSSKPLRQFQGIVHRVRTSVGGMHHELALIERDSNRAVVFQQAPHLGREAVDAAVATLGLKELRAADLIALPPLFDAIRISPLPRQAAAA